MKLEPRRFNATSWSKPRTQRIILNIQRAVFKRNLHINHVVCIGMRHHVVCMRDIDIDISTGKPAHQQQQQQHEQSHLSVNICSVHVVISLILLETSLTPLSLPHASVWLPLRLYLTYSLLDAEYSTIRLNIPAFNFLGGSCFINRMPFASDIARVKSLRPPSWSVQMCVSLP